MEQLSDTPLLDLLVPLIDIIIGHFLRMLLAGIILKAIKVDVFLKPVPFIGVPACVIAIAGGHVLGTLTLIGFFLIDWVGLLNKLLKIKTSKEKKK